MHAPHVSLVESDLSIIPLFNILLQNVTMRASWLLNLAKPVQMIAGTIGKKEILQFGNETEVCTTN